MNEEMFQEELGFALLDRFRETWNEVIENTGYTMARTLCPKSELPRKNPMWGNALVDTIRVEYDNGFAFLEADEPRKSLMDNEYEENENYMKPRIRVAKTPRGLRWYLPNWTPQHAVVTADSGFTPKPFLTEATKIAWEEFITIFPEREQEVISEFASQYGY